MGKQPWILKWQISLLFDKIFVVFQILSYRHGSSTQSCFIFPLLAYTMLSGTAHHLEHPTESFDL
jgi:hypothetical protein